MENKITVNTPEGVQLSFEVAGIGSRFAALLLDTLIQDAILLIIIFSLITAGITFENVFSDVLSWYTAVLILIIFIVFFGYFIFFEIILHGRTPGKALMKLRVIKSNGQPVTIIASLLRNIFRLADFFPFFYGVGVIVMFISKEARRLGDYVAGTLVVKEYVSKLPSVAEMPEKVNQKTMIIYPLNREEYNLIKEFLSRRQQLSPDKRNKIAQQLSDHFYNKFNIPIEDRKP
ncbi:MAG: RDD family protein, partial [Clostridiaceae bacterium]|nr:RDD family protein [Clostridiaceae bacterium]